MAIGQRIWMAKNSLIRMIIKYAKIKNKIAMVNEIETKGHLTDLFVSRSNQSQKSGIGKL